MKKALLLMAVMSLFPRLLVAQDFNVDSLLGENWYGLYLNGQKAGYSLNALRKDAENRVIQIEDARFKMSMQGVKQDLHMSSTRIYGADGALISIESQVLDQSGKSSEFSAHVEGAELVLISHAGGATEEKRLPKPSESLADAVKHAKWVCGKPQIGDTIRFNVFEPMYQREVPGVSTIAAIEDRLLEGVSTKVYKIKTSHELMGIESVSYVSESGLTLEDVIAGIITMRLEPEASAKDVNYSNDVIVSNAALVEAPIDNPRTRDSLTLELRGPLNESHMFTDERQSMERKEDAVIFHSRKTSLNGFTPVKIPVKDETVREWLKPTVFVQSEDPRLIAKGKEIAGDETDAVKVSNKLCAWVHSHMRSVYTARLTNALEVLSSLEGDCTENSILFIGLARAVGLPAQEVAGVIYVEGSKPGFYFHQWARVWVGKWIDVDPTFNEPLADVTHIKLGEGDLYQQAKLIPIIGNLKVQVMPETAAPAASK
jgi:hypothetical protein